MRRAKVIKDHQGSDPHPLSVKAGEVLEGEEKATQWEGWLWCWNSAGISGWVPKNFLEEISTKPGHFRVLRDYTTKELTINIGEELTILFEESSWVWVRKENDEEGWVPLENLRELISK